MTPAFIKYIKDKYHKALRITKQYAQPKNKELNNPSVKDD